jgi:hypothetical protein
MPQYELVDSASMILDPLWIGDACVILMKTRHNRNHLYPGVIGRNGISVKLVA